MVISSDTIRKRLLKAALNQDWMLDAPVFIVVLADLERAADVYGERGVKLYALQDTAAAVQNLLLAVVDAVLALVGLAPFSESYVSRSLDLARHFRPVAIIPISVPVNTPAPASAKRFYTCIVPV